MSEFTKLNQKFLNCQTKLLMFLSDYPDINLSLNDQQFIDLANLLSDLESIFSNVQKFYSKRDFVDPVSQIPRFGNVMKQKIMDLHSQVEKVFLNDIPLIKEYQRLQLEKKLEKERLEQLEICDSSRILIEEDKEEADAAEAEFQQQQIQKDLIIREEAEKLRLKKKAKSELRSMFIQQLRSHLSQNPKDELPTFIQHLFSQLERSDVLQMLSFLLNLLNKISNNPDDQLLRKMRLDHPIIMEKVTRLLGSLKLLLILGYQYRLEPIDDEVEIESYVSDKEIIDSFLYSILYEPEPISLIDQYILENSQETSKLLQMTRGLHYRLFFEMEEVYIDMNGNGFNEWKIWFDTLKKNCDILQMTIDSMKG